MGPSSKIAVLLITRSLNLNLVLACFVCHNGFLHNAVFKIVGSQFKKLLKQLRSYV